MRSRGRTADGWGDSGAAADRSTGLGTTLFLLPSSAFPSSLVIFTLVADCGCPGFRSSTELPEQADSQPQQHDNQEECSYWRRQGYNPCVTAIYARYSTDL